MSIERAIRGLRAAHRSVPRPLELPTTAQVEDAERVLGVEFPGDYRRFLLEASDVSVGTREPFVLTRPGSRLDLLDGAREAWDLGVPADWIPFCEDNGDYFGVTATGDVRHFSHGQESREVWPSLSHWIESEWLDDEQADPEPRSAGATGAEAAATDAAVTDSSTGEPDESQPPLSGARAFLTGGFGCAAAFLVLFLILPLVGGHVWADEGGLVMLFLFGGVIGLIVRAIYQRGTAAGRRP